MVQEEEVVVQFQLLLLTYRGMDYFQLKEVSDQIMEEEEVLGAGW
jgi:hypothetical protein